MQLKDLTIGSKARILAIRQATPEYRRRLIMLGVTPGAQIEVIRLAPLGDPIEIRVRNSLISIRKQEADLLELAAID